jgi:cystathionine beta-lyase/cystathionine gamma-synthase
MKHLGGSFPFQLKAGETQQVEQFCNRLQRLLLACS